MPDRDGNACIVPMKYVDAKVSSSDAVHRKAVLALVAALTLLAAGPAFGRDQTLDPEDFWKTAGISLAVPAAGFLLSLLPAVFPETAGVIPWIIHPSQLLAHIPLYWLDPGKALLYSGGLLALPAAGVGAMFLAGENVFLQQASGALLGAYQNLTQFSVYEVYKEFREKVPAGTAYRDDFRGVSLAHVLAGEFTPRNLIRPVVWLPTLIGPAVLTGYRLLADRDELAPVWTTGEAYVGDRAVHPVGGFFYMLATNVLSMSLLAAGEEALYRGVIYEEIKSRTGPRMALLADAVIFPLIHVPGDVYAGFGFGTVAFQFLWRSGMTLVFDKAYDTGGLPLSAAVHMWSDVVLLMVRWLVFGGAPESSSSGGTRIAMLLPEEGGMTIRFMLPLSPSR